MSHRTATFVAWSVWTAGAVLLLAAVVLSAANRPVVDSESAAVVLSQGAALVAIGGVGLLVSARCPKNAIGWLYLSVWVGAASYAWVRSFSVWATVTNPGMPGGTLGVWLSNWWWAPTIGVLLTYPLLLFPDGHLPTQRWRPFAWGTGVLIGVWSLMFAFAGEDFVDASGTDALNPFTPSGLVEFFDIGKNALALGFIGAVIACVVSLVGRFRRGSELQRAQIKWLILSGLVSVAFLLVPEHGGGTWIDALGGLVWVLLPVSVAVAILRYRLFEIDRIISRTTSYAVVTAALLLIYLVVVGAVSQLLPNSSSNALAVAAATLAAAALFRPVLTRVQGAVDRRFNRSRYDAQRTLDAFAVRLRDSSDPDRVAEDLLDVVERIAEPTVTSLWTVSGRPEPPAVLAGQQEAG